MKKNTRRGRNDFQVGDRVEITRKDIAWGSRKKQKFGHITRIDGGYHYVRPRWWKQSEVFELYAGEIRHAPLDKNKKG